MKFSDIIEKVKAKLCTWFTKKDKMHFFIALNFFVGYVFLLAFAETVIYWKVQGTLKGIGLGVYAFIPAIAMLLTALSGWFKQKWPNRILNTVIPLAVTVFYMSQIVYFSIFGSMYSLSMVGMGADAMENFGWSMGSTLKNCLGILLVLLIPFAVIMAVRHIIIFKSNFSAKFHGLAAICAVLLWILAVLLLPLGGKGAASAYNAYHDSLVDTDTAASKIGVLANSGVEFERLIYNTVFPDNKNDMEDDGDIEWEEPEPEPDPTGGRNIFPELDFAALAEKTKNKDIKSICEYLAHQTGTNRNEFTGKFKGYNLIYICAESFSSYAVDETITPTLYKLANNGIVLNNYYNAFKNTTTNGEFSMLTALWPDVSRYAKMGSNKGSFAQSAANLMPMGLGTLFNEQCPVVARGYHNYKGSYYCRNQTLPNLGFKCKFMNDGMKFTSSWPSSDLEMMQQSVDDYINDEQFCAYYMTFSGHGPYSDENVIHNRNIAEVKKLAKGRGYGANALGYFATNMELDKAMAYLLERLEAAGKLENTVIVLTGDHYPYYLYDSSRNKIAGKNVDTTFDIYKSTCTIYCAGIKEPIVTNTYCCNVDILPTVLNLFGINYDSRLLAGTDIFSDAPHVAMLYNKSYLAEGVRYDSNTGKAKWNSDSTLTAEEKKAQEEKFKDYVTAKYKLSLKIVDKDFYRFLYKNSNLTTTAK